MNRRAAMAFLQLHLKMEECKLSENFILQGLVLQAGPLIVEESVVAQ